MVSSCDKEQSSSSFGGAQRKINDHDKDENDDGKDDDEPTPETFQKQSQDKILAKKT